jgi:hypothetical protein
MYGKLGNADSVDKVIFYLNDGRFDVLPQHEADAILASIRENGTHAAYAVTQPIADRLYAQYGSPVRQFSPVANVDIYREQVRGGQIEPKPVTGFGPTENDARAAAAQHAQDVRNEAIRAVDAGLVVTNIDPSRSTSLQELETIVQLSRGATADAPARLTPANVTAQRVPTFDELEAQLPCAGGCEPHILTRTLPARPVVSVPSAVGAPEPAAQPKPVHPLLKIVGLFALSRFL